MKLKTFTKKQTKKIEILRIRADRVFKNLRVCERRDWEIQTKSYKFSCLMVKVLREFKGAWKEEIRFFSNKRRVNVEDILWFLFADFYKIHCGERHFKKHFQKLDAMIKYYQKHNKQKNLTKSNKKSFIKS